MTTPDDRPVHDPYGGCETECAHDLARGILTSDLETDGPYSPHGGFPDAGMNAAATLLRLMRDREESDASDTS